MNKFDAIHYVSRYRHPIAIDVSCRDQNLHFHLHTTIAEQRLASGGFTGVKLNSEVSDAVDGTRMNWLTLHFTHIFNHAAVPLAL